jgi:hypothetical protein
MTELLKDWWPLAVLILSTASATALWMFKIYTVLSMVAKRQVEYQGMFLRHRHDGNNVVIMSEALAPELIKVPAGPFGEAG